MGSLTRKLALIALIAGAAAFLLWPMADDALSVRWDTAALEGGKKRYLARLEARVRDTQRRPNVVLLLADDLGKEDISLHGSPYVTTPNIDSIGHDGISFDSAYCSAPICAPSRAGLLTGRYQQRFGFELQPNNRYTRNMLEYLIYRYVIDTGDMVPILHDSVPPADSLDLQGLPPSEITLAEALSSAGYATAAIGKWHLGHGEYSLPLNRGFDYHYGFYEAFSLFAPVDDPDIVNVRLDDFADRHIWRQGRRGLSAIRRQGEIIEESGYLTERIADEAIGFLRENRDRPFFLYVPFSAPHTPFQAPREYVERFDHVRDPIKRVYYAMIAALDDDVGRILDELERSNLTENTLIIFAGDNGGAAYTGATDNGSLKGGKFTNFEGGVNVPAMLRWDGVVPSGTVHDAPVSLLDFFPTCLAAAGIPLPEDRVIDGVDLLPFVTGRTDDPPHRALFFKSDYNHAVRAGRWKLIRNLESAAVHLYDLVEDPGEANNLAADRPVVVDELTEILDSFVHELPGPAWPGVMHYVITIDGERLSFAL